MDHIFNVLTLINIVLNIIFFFFTLFFERKNPSSRIVWLLILTFIPYGGVILYILFSGHFFTKTPKMIYVQKLVANTFKPILDNQKKFINTKLTDFSSTQLQSNLPIINMNMHGANSILTFTEDIKIFCWGQDFYAALIEDIKNAKQTIHMEYFIWNDDKIGSQILDLLCQKVLEGVKVKIIYDDIGSLRTNRRFFNPLKKAGGIVLPFFNIRKGFAFSVNFRNHRKITIIDNKIAYSGGINIGDEYANCSDKQKWKYTTWRDTQFRLTGNTVFIFQSIFLMDFYSISNSKSFFRKLKEKKISFRSISSENSDKNSIIKNLSDISFEKNKNITYIQNILNNESSQEKLELFFKGNYIPTQVVTSGPDDIRSTEIRDMLIRMILSAKKTIRIQSPYFTPDETFLSSLKIAASSGVNVQIMLPAKWDKWYVREAAFEFISECLSYGINFYAYNGFIHSKLCIIDNQMVSIGTTNIDNRSFTLHFEVNTIFYSQELSDKCNNIFEDDIKNSKKLQKSDIKKYFILRRALWGFFRLFSPLM